MKSIIKHGVEDNLNVDFDLEASRLARVFVSHGRVEIVLCNSDPEWVDQALKTIADKYPTIVIACPTGAAA